ncbi:hypothetical protein CALCODRAFT_114053 [Calocera cornea HHB12733]|uniref:G-protein coupled receptors family 1 profile domain-containing protein n=1 Tax=Calocera cornea HHB12733 TaxID=1353952 RepID=A0A165D049_9BASI|nr:hypothetical protein CALCODRAFT_114053 [Calocera cornea HHB12733]
MFNSTWLLVSAALRDALLMLRALALFNDRRKLYLSLKIGYRVTYSIEVALLCYYMRHPPNRQVGAVYYAGNLGCVITSLSNDDRKPTVADIILAVATAPVVLFNIILVVLVFHNILPAYRRNVGGKYTPLYTAVLRDGGMYFALVTASAIAVAITPLIWYDRPDRNNTCLPWFMGISPVAASRLFLNLRASAGKLKDNDSVAEECTQILSHEELEGVM